MTKTFSPKQPVRWLAPKEIFRGASGEFFGGLFSKYADNRDRQALARPMEVYRHSSVELDLEDSPLKDRLIDGAIGQDVPADEAPSEFVVDYVADVGDGFGATYAIAELMARPTLDLTGASTINGRETVVEHSTTRGSVLAFGGDQVYPVASEEDYDNRMVGPYRLAYKHLEEENTTLPVYAIPGNHDWYDGLASFLRIFTNDGGIYRNQSNLRSVQSRSYYALALPHGWWLWGLDTGLGSDGRLDLAQVQYFRDVFKVMDKSHRVIISIAEPSWIKRAHNGLSPNREVDGWDDLVAFLSSIILPPNEDDDWYTQANSADLDLDGYPLWTDFVRLVISGDKHFYTRHQPTDDNLPVLITSGGGGAYLSGTTEVQQDLDLNLTPHPSQTTPVEPIGADFTAEEIWPSKKESRRRAFWGLLTVPPRNPRMSSVIGSIYALFTYAFITGLIQPTLQPNDGAGRLNLAVKQYDGHCLVGLGQLNDVPGCLGSLPSDLLRGTVKSFASVLVAALIVIALALFASSGWKNKFSSPIKRWAVTAAAGGAHILLHAIALATTIVLSINLVINVQGEGAVQLNLRYIWILWLAVTIAALIPVIAIFVTDGVFDSDGLAILAIPVFILVPLSLFEVNGETTDLLAAAIAVVLAAALLGGALGMAVFTIYLVVSQFYNVHLNELFVGLRSEDYKQFLRLIINRREVRVFSIGYKSVSSRTVKWDDNGEPRVVSPVAPDGYELVDYVRVHPTPVKPTREELSRRSHE